MVFFFNYLTRDIKCVGLDINKSLIIKANKERMAYNIPSIKNISKLFKKFNYETKFIPYIVKKTLNKINKYL